MKEGPTEGHIEVITGPMFSGKTEELIRRLRRERIGGGDFLVFKPRKDDRYGDSGDIFSHNGEKIEAQLIDADQREGVIEAYERASGSDADVVAFDESNFWHGSLKEACDLLAHEDGKRVIVAGLDTDFRGEPFTPTPEIIAIAEYVDKLTARCVKCGRPANRTQRIVNGEPANYDDDQIVVGGKEKYQARCSSCHEIPGKKESLLNGE